MFRLISGFVSRSAAATPAASGSAAGTTSKAARVPFARAAGLQQQQQRVAFVVRRFATTDMSKLRNIGIAAHIDSGKTTCTERILYYTGRIKEIHEVKGKDGVGAKMDFMELEREKGITIQSAATYAHWGDYQLNIIDTPGHVDFTIEVERALRVLDGAVMVLCGVAGVQSQTFTVDRQMKRYNVPRLAFVNKLDRAGADPWRAVAQVRSKLGLNAAAVQLPIGVEDRHEGVVDLVRGVAYYFDGAKGSDFSTDAIPKVLQPEYEKRRQELIDTLVELDDQLQQLVLIEEKTPSEQQLRDAIRRHTIARNFVPIFMGSALKNKGVQPLLDGVIDYLPTPTDSATSALNLDKAEEPLPLSADPEKPLVALAFKLEEGRFGQLTFMRVYQGTMRRGMSITNTANGKKVKVARLVRMHANEMEEIQEAVAGEICALFGVDCHSGNTFTDGTLNVSMTSMHVPAPVISLAISTESREQSGNFTKALAKFTKEDPTFRVHFDSESGQTIISGMGELHLEIYVERMLREFKVPCRTGKPQVAFRETIAGEADFNYTHKKQSGGAGQFARVAGKLEAIDWTLEPPTEFVDAVIGGTIPPEFVPACEKGFVEAVQKGPLLGAPLIGVRMTVVDGLHHPVDSSELAFRLATIGGFREAFGRAQPQILEPVMDVEVTAPLEFQGVVIGGLNRRKGVIASSDTIGDLTVIHAEVPLENMFGYSTDLRSATQGKAEFSMEFKKYAPVARDVQNKMIEEAKKKKQAGE